MNVLGIGDHVSCGGAILRDGVFSSVVIDEGWSGREMVFGVPRQGIAKNLELSGDFREGWFGLQRGKVKQIIFDTASKVAPGMRFMPWLPHAYYLVREPFFAQRRQAWRRILREEFGIGAPVEFIDHHYCHATSAYWAGGFEDCLPCRSTAAATVFPPVSTTIRNGRMRMVHAVRSYNSLGVFYSHVTQICDFKAGRHEGKVTGLAARGEPRYTNALRQLMRYENGTIKECRRHVLQIGSGAYPRPSAARFRPCRPVRQHPGGGAGAGLNGRLPRAARCSASAASFFWRLT